MEILEKNGNFGENWGFWKNGKIGISEKNGNFEKMRKSEFWKNGKNWNFEKVEKNAKKLGNLKKMQIVKKYEFWNNGNFQSM